MVHIGTHTVGIEAALREIFQAVGWQLRWYFSLQGERETPYGSTCFDDCVQSWVNPAFLQQPGGPR